MSIIDKLLKMDKSKLVDLPTKELEIKRLSDIFGEPFKITCRAINGERYAEIQKLSFNLSKSGGLKDVNIFDMQVLTVLDGVIDPKLSDKALLGHFECLTPKQLVNKLFLSGEIVDISKVINELSGYQKQEDVDDEIKN